MNSDYPENPPLPGAKNVLFLAPQPFYRLRGACLAEKKCLESLSALGLRVTLLAFPGGTDLSMPGLRIKRLPVIRGAGDVPIGPSAAKFIYDIMLALYLLPLLLLRRYEVVHACEEAAVIAAFYRLFFDFRLVYDMDDVLSRRLELSGFLRSRLLLGAVRALERFALRSADLVLTNSADTTAYAESVCPGKTAFYDHVPHVPPSGEAAAPGDSAPVIAYAGNLEPYQGVGLLLEALPRVFAAARARCVIIGGEPAQIAAYRARAEALGIGALVEWRGKTDIEETFAALCASAVLVSPMVQDKAVPSKIYMYMAAGRPIVATNTANHHSLLKEGAGIMVPPRAADLAGALLRVLEDKPLGQSLADRARAVFLGISGSTDLRAILARAYGLTPP